MELYTFEEATYLLEYYRPLIIGNKLEESTGSIVVQLVMLDYGEGSYRLVGVGSMYGGAASIKRSLNRIAKTQNLSTPNNVLKKRNR